MSPLTLTSFDKYYHHMFCDEDAEKIAELMYGIVLKFSQNMVSKDFHLQNYFELNYLT
jgi:hypothetical protein